jgi:hypothetical protein
VPLGRRAGNQHRRLGSFRAMTSPPVSREQLVEELAAVSHSTWIRQGVRDYGKDPSDLSPEVHPHDRERAEDTVTRLEELGVVNWD